MVEWIGHGHLNEKQKESKAKLEKCYKCELCKGEGTKACNSTCVLWKDIRINKSVRIGKFLYNFIADDKSTETTGKHIAFLAHFVWYLKDHGFPEVDNVQDLEGFYVQDKDKDRNDLVNRGYLQEEAVKQFIRYLRDEKQVGSSEQKNHLGTICKGYELNGVHLDRAVLYKVVGEDENEDPVYGYDRKQIKMIMSKCKHTGNMALIAVYASSGPRRGGIWDTAVNKKTGKHTYLKIKDFKLVTAGLENVRLEGGNETALDFLKRHHPTIVQKPVFVITYYRGSKYEYRTPCSREATKLWLQYLQERKDAGEEIEKDRVPDPKESLESWMERNSEAPAFRYRFRAKSYYYYHKKKGDKVHKQLSPSHTYRETRRLERIRTAMPLTVGAIKRWIYDLREEIGDSVKFTQDQEHHRIPMLHGYRHFHKVAMMHAGVDSDLRTWLQGRKLEASEEAYNRGGWPDYKRVVEYSKAMHALTIDREDDLEAEVQLYKTEIHDRDTEKKVDMSWKASMVDQMIAMQNVIKRVLPFLPPEDVQEVNKLSDSLPPLDLKKANIINVRKEEDF